MTNLSRRSFVTLSGAASAGAFVAAIGAVPAVASPSPQGPSASDAAVAPRTREFRAMWIASTDNIDYPSRTGLSVEESKAEFIAWLDLAKELNLNAVISQIRPAADAFWPSPYEPWSQFLTGEQGKDPGFDPLAFQIEEAHKRNLEFHAWYNPFRVSMTESVDHLVPDHPALVNEGWAWAYGTKTYFDPGIPEVREHSLRAIMHSVEHYDIDAVHFDDYFYPYKVEGKDYPDQATYERYSDGTSSLDDWRRENITIFIREMRDRIRSCKPWVKFGISPFGIWRNNTSDPAGSATSGSESYEIICADSRAWVKDGLVDYINPQIYWPIGLEVADYAALVPWWNDVVEGTDVALYIGQAMYKQASGAIEDPEEMARHLDFNRDYPRVEGDVYFSAKSVRDERDGAMGEVVRRHYAHPAIVPVIAHMGGAAPRTPKGLKVRCSRGNAVVEFNRHPHSEATSFAIYRVSGARFDPAELADGRNLLACVRADEQVVRQSVHVEGVAGGDWIVVTALDRLWNESDPSKPTRAR